MVTLVESTILIGNGASVMLIMSCPVPPLVTPSEGVESSELTGSLLLFLLQAVTSITAMMNILKIFK
jgi:hypothetical protein